MAEDHRYSWLDDSAAERLLRGEPVEGQPGAPDGRGDESYAEAERLAAVLSAVAGAGRPAAPSDASALPGEEAAMAAFRAARVAVEAEAEAVAEPEVARRPQRIRKLRERQPRLRRPLRAGMIAMVAGCALSGFAAAAGVLPTPFGPSHHTPGPSVSMSDAGPGGESAHPEISEDGGTTAPGPSGSSDNDASDAGSNGTQGGTVTSGPEGGDTGKDGKTKGPSSKGKHGTPGWALRICPRYLTAELTGVDLDKKSLKKLTEAAGSESAIHGYCTQILADDKTGAPRSDDGGENPDNGGGDSGSDSGPDGGGNGGSDGPGSGDSGGPGGGDAGGDSGKDGGDDTTVPQPPPPPSDTTGTPSATTTPTPASDSAASTDSTDSVTATETGAD